jgi:microcin C transport system substrate-binding protein
VVPHFHSPVDRIAYWDKFGRPAVIPRFAGPQDAFLRVWWYDKQRADRMRAAEQSRR